MFTVSIDEAVVLLNQKKGGRTVLKELGAHPKTGVDVQILSGRYGPYVTDGTANASLSKDMEPDDLTHGGGRVDDRRRCQEKEVGAAQEWDTEIGLTPSTRGTRNE